MEGFKYLSSDAIQKSLIGVTRQYLTGNLKNPQHLDHIHDENIEIGITSYPEKKAELPHFHTVATEYQFIISGETTYINLDTNEEYTFRTGDFFVIYPNTKYAQKSNSETVILFIKNPSINDKINIELSSSVEKWYLK